MVEKNSDSIMEKKPVFTVKKGIIFSFAQIADVSAYQTFTFLIFTFYFTIVKLPIAWVTAGFIIWSVWNSINDPLLGHFSDKTHTKWGRRKPWMVIATIPLALVMVLLFTPPMDASPGLKFTYFIIIICVFEFFYTMYSLNQVSLFPEVFMEAHDRFNANNIKQIASIVGLLFAFLLPGFIIPDFTLPIYASNYIVLGIIVGGIVIVSSVIFLKWSPKERVEFKNDFKQMPGFLESLKISLKNKNFMRYMPTEVASWFVFGMIPTIVPLYGKFVLKIPEDSFLLGILMGFSFVSAAAFMPFWTWVGKKLGPRKSWMISQGCWIISLIPFMFIEESVPIAIASFIFMGCGMAGTLYFIDLVVSDIIDADEVETGVRREAAYYGINAFFCRTATIFVVLAINLVFDSVGWYLYDPSVVDDTTIMGLRILMFVFPAIALLIGIFAISKYPLDGEKLKEMKRKLSEIHAIKRKKISED